MSFLSFLLRRGFMSCVLSLDSLRPLRASLKAEFHVGGVSSKHVSGAQGAFPPPISKSLFSRCGCALFLTIEHNFPPLPFLRRLLEFHLFPFVLE